MSTIFQPNRLANYDDESIISEIRRVINEYFQGKAPREDEFEKYSLVKGSTIRRKFGSWTEALQKSGFDYKSKNYIDPKTAKEPMMSELQRVKELNGDKYFTRLFYEANGGKYSGKTLQKYLDCSSWQSLLEKQLSITPILITKIKKVSNQDKRISKLREDDLFRELKLVWDALGRRPSYTEFKNLGRIGIKVFVRRFNNWTSAIEWFYVKSGYNRKSISRRLKRRYADEDFFEAIQSLWEMFGRQPTYREMDRKGSISCKAFQNRFGSWMNAVHAFCEDRALARTENIEDENITSTSEKAYIEVVPIQPVVQSDRSSSDRSSSTPNETIILATPRSPSLRLRFQVMQRDSFRCVICGRSPANHLGLELQIDHIEPYSKGGPTSFENLRTLCRDCNLGKSDLLPYLK